MHRFREAVAGGAVPFGVQGPENALALDGGRTLGWEMSDVVGAELDRVFVQVGGGALAACVGRGSPTPGSIRACTRSRPQGCAPLARAWRNAHELGSQPGRPALGASACGRGRTSRRSVADGILDDETYDWLGVARRHRRQRRIGRRGSRRRPSSRPTSWASPPTGIPVSATGTAGLAGLLAIRAEVGDDERVAVVFSGRAR